MKPIKDSEVKDFFGMLDKPPREETEMDKALRRIKELNDLLQKKQTR